MASKNNNMQWFFKNIFILQIKSYAKKKHNKDKRQKYYTQTEQGFVFLFLIIKLDIFSSAGWYLYSSGIFLYY